MIYRSSASWSRSAPHLIVPVALACQVLTNAKQPSHRWLRRQFCDRGWGETRLTDAAFEAHRKAPMLGYRLIADERDDVGIEPSERRMWGTCRDNNVVNATERRRRGKCMKTGVPVHDDLVQCRFTADGPDRGSGLRSRRFVHALSAAGLVGFMGRVSAAGANAATASFFALLQKNILDQSAWAKGYELRLKTVPWIEAVYDRRRQRRLRV